MPLRKQPATQATVPAAIPSVRPNKRARRPRLCPEEAPTVHESTTTEQANMIASNPSSSSPGTMSADVDAITATISAVITQAAVNEDVNVITNPQSGIGAVDPIFDLVNTGPYDQRPQVQFTSVSVPLTSKQEEKYSLSMSPSVAGSSSQPQLTLEPCHVSKKITNISQWISACNIFVSVYAERFNNYTPQLMTYCEVVRDLASKRGDWHWYDEQFRSVRQSAPEQYPWDRIHWELWLQASNTFRKPQPPTTKPRFRSQFFPKGTCWDFQAVQKANKIVHRVLHSKPFTPVRVDRLEFLLHGYDRVLKQFLVDGFRFGFHIHFVGKRFSSESPNLKSALDQPV
ncbi:unnamed protein product, partial [Porites evermanni]